MFATMKRIPLTQGKYAIVDDEDYDRLISFKWCAVKSAQKQPRFYAVYGRRTGGKTRMIGMHRVIMDAKPGQIVDHVNRDSLDNRRKNLRFCTVAQNVMNSRKLSGSSKYKGVCKHKKYDVWVAHITVRGKVYFLGQSKVEEDAATLYNVAAQLFFGEFAYLNPV